MRIYQLSLLKMLLFIDILSINKSFQASREEITWFPCAHHLHSPWKICWKTMTPVLIVYIVFLSACRFCYLNIQTYMFLKINDISLFHNDALKYSWNHFLFYLSEQQTTCHYHFYSNVIIQVAWFCNSFWLKSGHVVSREILSKKKI